MNTLKSAAIMLVLAGVLYGVYTALNKPSVPPPPGVAEKHSHDLAPPLVEMGGNSASSLATSLPAPPSPLSHGHDGAHDHKHDHAHHDHEHSLAEADSVKEPVVSAGSAYSPDGLTGVNRQSNYESPLNKDENANVSPASAPPLEAPSVQPPPLSPPSPKVSEVAFRYALQEADQLVQDGKYKAALATLTSYYGSSDLTPEETVQLTAWLDALAAKVIYSREHLLEVPHEVRLKETLFDVAEQYHVPYYVLANINGVSDPQVLVPGTQLKIVPGPFRAEVNLTTSELTLFLNDLYAGRFPYALGNEPPQPGEYKVLDKRTDRTYYGPDGRTLPANDPANPYGNCWIDLGREACLHGSPQSPSADGRTVGCVSLSPQDAQDVYSILSQGSVVTIRR